MPNLKNAKKALKQSIKHATANKAVKDQIDFLTKKIRKAMEKKSIDEAKKYLNDWVQKIDKATKKNIIKKNTANRRKSRLMKKINNLSK